MSAPFADAGGGADLDEPGRAPWEAPCLHWTALFLVSLTHGGAEEGSWWFDSGELATDPALYARLGALPAAFLTSDEALGHAARMAAGVDALNEGRPPKHSVLSTGVYEVHVLETPSLPLHCPEIPPRYESEDRADRDPRAQAPSDGEPGCSVRHPDPDGPAVPPPTRAPPRAGAHLSRRSFMTMTTPDFQAYEAKVAVRDALAAEVAPANRAALFDALASAGIHTVVVAFDGSGDSGQIESVEAFGADNASMTLPAEPIGFGTVEFGSLHAEYGTRQADEIIETMAYEFLERTHDGWEDGDGAHGEFTFTVAACSIELDYNERYTASDHHHYEF